MVTKAQQDFCAHGFNIGFCPENCVKQYYHIEVAREKRRQFLKMFKKRDWKNAITRATIIHRLHEFHREEQYVQLPINLISFGHVRCDERPKSLQPIQ